MKIFRTGSAQIMLVAVITGVIAFWHLYLQQSAMLSDPLHLYDQKYGAAIEALSLTATVGAVISNCFKKIEERLNKIEQRNLEKQNPDQRG
jgi:hypothetical protein